MSDSKKNVWQMFDRIARRYDLLNRLLSGGQDVVWRNKLLKYVEDRPKQMYLDIATGTGDVALTLLKSPWIQTIHGVDMAEKMLVVAKKKTKKHHHEDQLFFHHGDAQDLPFEDNQFDGVTIAFGIRNVEDVSKAMREMLRVLKPGGQALILEFSLPTNPVVLKLYLFYFRYILPWIGGLISGSRKAYSYLNKTVETFPYGKRFLNLMQQAGFGQVHQESLTFGIASIYQGIKDK